MKTRFLDARNCHALLPSGHGLSLLPRLEESLREINDKEGPLKGSIDHLIKKNERTLGRSPGSMRYVDSPIEIAQAAFIADQSINVRAIQRPDRGPAKLHTTIVYENGGYWKAIVPLQFLLKSWGDANNGHQGYVHTIAHNLSQVQNPEDLRARALSDSDEYYYVGITGRNWLLRLGEHIGDLRRGSRKRFHTAWRESLGMEDVSYISTLQDINLTYDEAMKWEEVAVDRYAYGPNGLNMIPGGYTGLKHLHKYGIIARQNISLEERESALEEYLRQNPRKGIPNPMMSELWKDDDYYLRVIEARPKTLSREQVLFIRRLAAEGVAVEEIAEKVGALNEIQVKNVIAGRTYRRLH